MGVEFTLIYHKPNVVFGTIFIVSILGFLAFYLFQYGGLQSFSLEALSTKAKFIKQKAQEIKEDSKVIKELRKKNQEFTESIERILNDLEKSQVEINKYKSELVVLRDELVRVKMGFVEINYLQYAGRNIFPNPFHERIMNKLNELLEIAVPDPQRRAVFAQELHDIQKKKSKNRPAAFHAICLHNVDAQVGQYFTLDKTRYRRAKCC